MNKYLIIFIDSLPYELIGKLNLADRFSFVRALIPGIGYSINIHAEIFAGLSADQIGFFNTWKFEPQNSPFRAVKSFKKIPDNLQTNRYFNRIFREAIKYICGCDSLNIPYEFIDMFAPCGYTIDSGDFPEFKLLPTGITGQDIISGTDVEKYGLAMEKMAQEGRLSVFFVELDGIAHKYGLDSRQYTDYFLRLNGWLNNLCDKYSSIYPDGDIVILSDHGMSEVKTSIRFGPEKGFPLPEEHRYVYFLDTTMLRIWYLNGEQSRTIDSKAKEAMESFLKNKDYGRLLSEEERLNFGIADKKWADTVFLLNEGYVFDPSFLEKGHPLAMHGYDPRLPRQKGVFLYSGPKAFNLGNTFTTLDCHNILKEILSSGKN